MQDKSSGPAQLITHFFLYTTIFVCIVLSFFLIGKDLYNTLSGNNLYFSYGIFITTTFILYPFFKKIRTNLSLFIITFTAFLFLSDILMRNLLADRMFSNPDNEFTIDYPPATRLLIRYKKNVKSLKEGYGDIAIMSGLTEYKETRTIKFETDDLGFRNRKDQRLKQNDMILLGDSFGVGSGTHQDSTTHAFLEEETQKSIYNLSFPGYPIAGVTNLVLEYPKLTLNQNPQVVWLIFTGNDLPFAGATTKYDKLNKALASDDPNNLLEKNILKLWKYKLGSYLKTSAYQRLIRSIFGREQMRTNADRHVTIKTLEDGRKVMFMKNYIAAANMSEDSIGRRAGLDKYKHAFEVAASFCENNGMNLNVFLVPTKYEVYREFFNEEGGTPSGFSKILENICSDLGIAYFDTSEKLFDEARSIFENSGELLFWRDDTHLNVLGSKKLAQIIATSLMENNH